MITQTERRVGMKITTFNPQIITNNPEPVIELFQVLGFEKRHDQKEIGELKVEGIRMKDANGFPLDISVSPVSLPKDLIAIRINVDDFDEAYQFFMEYGFKNYYGDQTVDSKSARSAILISESGLGINLVQHIKK